MTALRHRMTQDLQLRGYADRTVEAYVGAVARLAQFYDTCPDQLSEEQVRQYLVHLNTGRKVARSRSPAARTPSPSAVSSSFTSRPSAARGPSSTSPAPSARRNSPSS